MSRKISIHLPDLHSDVSSLFEGVAVFTRLAHADRISRLKLLGTKSYTVLEKNLLFQELFLKPSKIDSKKKLFSHYLGVKITW